MDSGHSVAAQRFSVHRVDPGRVGLGEEHPRSRGRPTGPEGQSGDVCRRRGPRGRALVHHHGIPKEGGARGERVLEEAAGRHRPPDVQADHELSPIDSARAQLVVSLNVGWSVSSGRFFQYPFTSRPAFFRYAVMMSERSSAGTSATAYVTRLPFWPSRTTPAARMFLTQSDSPRVDTMNREPLCCNGMTGIRCGSTALRRATSRVCTSHRVLRIAKLFAKLLKILVVADGLR